MTSTLRKEFLGALPPELCLQILQSLGSKTAISALIRASPRMLQAYLGYKAQIIWHILALDFDKDMIQDAIFIIQLPRSAGPLYIEEEYEPWKAVVNQWIEKELPDPIASRDKSSQLFWSLDKLHSVLIRLSEDYMTKARSEYNVQSYPCLPQMGPSQRHLAFKGKEVMTRMDAGLLQQSQRRKLLESFLFYEWTAMAMRTQLIFSILNSDFEPLLSKPRKASLPDEKGWLSPEKDFYPITGIIHQRLALTSPAIFSAFNPYDYEWPDEDRLEDLPEALPAWGLDVLVLFLNLDVTLADDRELIEDYFGTTITNDGNSSEWMDAYFDTVWAFQHGVLLTSGELRSDIELGNWEYLDDSKPRGNRPSVDEERLRREEEGPHGPRFHTEVALHRNRMARKGNSGSEGRSPLPKLIETGYGCHIIEQSPAFWRVGLRSS